LNPRLEEINTLHEAMDETQGPSRGNSAGVSNTPRRNSVLAATLWRIRAAASEVREIGNLRII
jgi:hypothetical protein